MKENFRVQCSYCDNDATVTAKLVVSWSEPPQSLAEEEEMGAYTSKDDAFASRSNMCPECWQKFVRGAESLKEKIFPE